MILLLSFILSNSFNSTELIRLKELSSSGAKHAKIVAEKFDKLYKEQPKLKKYMQPSKRDLLEKLREKKGKGVDTLYILAIRAEFQPDTSSRTTGNGIMDIDRNEFPYDSLGSPTTGYRHIYEDLWDTPFDEGGHNLYYDPPHTKRYFEHLMEGLQSYWWTVSEHQLWLEYRVVPDAESTSYELPYSLLYYGEPWDFERGLLTLFKDVITTCDRESPGIDFSKYAGNSGAVIIFHAGGCWQTDYMWDSDYDIPAAFITNVESYFGTPIWVDNQTVPINEGILYPQTAFQDGVYGFLQGGLVHEFGHQLGLFDLYDTEGGTMGMGGWDLMGTGNWNLDGLLPPYICAWNAEKLGFITPVKLNRDTSVSIAWRGGPITGVPPKVYEIPITTGERFLVEERFAYVPQKDTTYIDTFYSADSCLHLDSSSVRVWKDGVMTWFNDYDFGLPCDTNSGGLAIWHIDEAKLAADSLYNSINAGSPKAVDMEEADGVQDFETPIKFIIDGMAAFYGRKYDLFYKDTTIPHQENDSFCQLNAYEFTPYTSPNTNDNNGGMTNVYITDISFSDTIMSFNLKFENQLAGFPTQVTSFFSVNSPNVAEVNGNSVIFCGGMDTLSGNKIYACNSAGNILWSRLIPTENYLGFYGSPAIGDVNGDGVLDIAVTSFTGEDTVIEKGYKIKHIPLTYQKAKADSNTVIKITGQLYVCDIYGNQIFVNSHVSEAAIYGSPLLADINKDGKDEIIFGSEDNQLVVFKGDGDTLWIKNLHSPIWTTPVYDSASNTLYATSFDGRLWAIEDTVTKWIALEPYVTPTTCSPVVCDFNNDGTKEIIMCTGESKMYCISDSGTILWSKELEGIPFYSSPVVADIDKDLSPDIILAIDNKIYGFNGLGNNLPGFPINTGTEWTLQGAPVTGDINNDSIPELVIGTPEGKVLAYNNRGKLVKGFPLATGNSIYSTPLLADINKDGKLDILVTCDDGKLYGFSLGEYGKLEWTKLHFNPENNRILDWTINPAQIAKDIFMNKDFYVYPNPIMGRGYIRYFSGDADRVDIKVINLAGKVLNSFRGKIGLNNYQDEVLPDLPFGIYICRVEVTSGGKSYVRFKKFAVTK